MHIFSTSISFYYMILHRFCVKIGVGDIMRLRNVKNAVDIVNNSEYTILEPEKYTGQFNSLFNNDNKVLKIDDFEQLFSGFIGSLYHQILSIYRKKKLLVLQTKSFFDNKPFSIY